MIRDFLLGGVKIQPRAAQGPRSTLSGAKAAVVSLATALVLSAAAGGAQAATTLSVTKSVTIPEVTAEWSLHYANCPGSSNVCDAQMGPDNGMGRVFSLTFDGLDLPTGATITSANLSWSLPYVTKVGGSSAYSVDSADDINVARQAGIFSYATLYGQPNQIIVGGDTYFFGFNPGVPNRDLLALGFGPALMAGDAVTFHGLVATNRLSWGLTNIEANDDRDPNPGFNVVEDVYLYVGFQNIPVTATLDVTYDEPTTGVPEPATWAMMLTGFASAGALLRRRRRIGGRFSGT